ncbi:MAG: sigma 54-interacting transcriptional regulator [Lutispora sp.]|uniref:sigma 54-interacting transcriptional regulator n=1 Tax=Lutispora sp. TaxID=2828727 RepID=UPI003561AA75
MLLLLPGASKKGLVIIFRLFEEQDRELEVILDSINDAITIVDKDGITKYWNAAAEKMYGIKKEDIIGKHIKEFFPSSLLQRIIKEKKSYDNIYNSPRENTFNIISASPLYYNGELVGGLSLDRDVTDHIRTTELLSKARSNLDVLQKEMTAINKNRSSFSTILGNSRKFREAVNLARDVARSNINVLIYGESGTGKELFARAIHMESGREGLYVPINCSAIPNDLMESELFGYAGGAFTGALKEGKTGKIELAHRGTLFLDEIGDMPLHMQPKILRVLEDGVVTKIGSEKSVKVNIRVIAATNRNLEEMVEKGTFRKDLYYRLNSVLIKLPPLKERKDDIPLLANRFVQDYCMEYGLNILNISPQVMDAFIQHDWEGNVRELTNVIERMVVIAKNNKLTTLDVDTLPENITYKYNKRKAVQSEDNPYDLNKVLANAERNAVINAMKMAENNKSKAAKLLNIPRSTLYFKLKKYGLEN